MTTQQIIDILKAHEQIVYLPKNARKNPLTQGVIRENYQQIADNILLIFNSLNNNNMDSKTHPAHEQGPKLPTPGRIVLYYHNGNDEEAAVNGAEYYPALVIQSFGTDIANLRVFTYSDEAPLLRSSVHHMGEHNPNQPYWKWPEIK